MKEEGTQQLQRIYCSVYQTAEDSQSAESSYWLVML